jgi:hypothetical protein
MSSGAFVGPSGGPLGHKYFTHEDPLPLPSSVASVTADRRELQPARVGNVAHWQIQQDDSVALGGATVGQNLGFREYEILSSRSNSAMHLSKPPGTTMTTIGAASILSSAASVGFATGGGTGEVNTGGNGGGRGDGAHLRGARRDETFAAAPDVEAAMNMRFLDATRNTMTGASSGEPTFCPRPAAPKADTMDPMPLGIRTAAEYYQRQEADSYADVDVPTVVTRAPAPADAFTQRAGALTSAASDSRVVAAAADSRVHHNTPVVGRTGPGYGSSIATDDEHLVGPVVLAATTPATFGRRKGSAGRAASPGPAGGGASGAMMSTHIAMSPPPAPQKKAVLLVVGSEPASSRRPNANHSQYSSDANRAAAPTPTPSDVLGVRSGIFGGRKSSVPRSF